MLANNKLKVPAVFLCMVVFLMGLFLRFYGLRNRGIFMADEAAMLLTARTWASLPGVLKDLYRSNTPLGSLDSEALKARFPHADPRFATPAKPGQALPLALLMGLIGSADWVGFGFSALAGSFTILIVYLIGKELVDEYFGVIAAALISFSPYHIFYSRSAYSLAISAFAMSLSLYLILKSFQAAYFRNASRFLLWGGIAAGYAIVSHHSLFIVPAFLLPALWAANRFTKRTALAPFIKNAAILLGGITILLGIFSSPLLLKILAKIIMGEDTPSLISKFLSWPQEFIRLMTLNKNLVQIAHRDYLFYAKSLLIFDGWFFTGLLATGAIWWAAGRFFKNPSWLALATVPFGLFIFYNITPLQAPRTLVSILPLLYVFGALPLHTISKKLTMVTKLHFISVAAIILILLLTSFKADLRIVKMQSTYKQVSNFLASRYAGAHITSLLDSILSFYTDVPIDYPKPEEFILRNGRAVPPIGDVFVVDWAGRADFREYFDSFEKTYAPVATFDNTQMAFIPMVRDGYVQFSYRETQTFTDNKEYFRIKIYELAKSIKSTP